ncbi:MAG: sterol desaturase family protein [Acidimicrobiales bacterium]
MAPRRDLTLLAVPGYFAAIALEHALLRRRARRHHPTTGGYERNDTIASLTMGTASVIVPLVINPMLRQVTPGRGRYGKAVVTAAVGAAAVTTVADAMVRRLAVPPSATPPTTTEGSAGSLRTGDARVSLARRIASVGGVVTVTTGGLCVSALLRSALSPENLWRRRLRRPVANGPMAAALAILGWDFVYYWNHRFMHESRFMWAAHVVHHSSERYNLSTALRQPVAEAATVPFPYGALCLFGISPALVEMARGVNLLYQFWIHTETIGRLGPPEAVLNTPSHHRAHHGSNPQYLDRNHGSILIVWDRLFGTFEPEGEPVVYGLTKDIKTFNPLRIATHEHARMLADVAGAEGWNERLSYLLRGPGWIPARLEATSVPAS